MGKPYKIWAFLLLLFCVSCTEDIVIDVEKGESRIGVEAYLTNELKQHEAILSYSSEFYHADDVRMISGATVYVTDGIDTIYYYEDQTREGHYFTDSVAGKKRTLYCLNVDLPEDAGSVTHFKAESYLNDNVNYLDSIVIKSLNGSMDTLPSVFNGDTVEWIYPYFQSLPNPLIVYYPKVYKNDTLVSDSLSLGMMIPVGGYAGYYINGPEMQAMNKEIPAGYIMKSKLKRDDRIRLELSSITTDYLMYVYTLMMSMGSNPMLGAPSNVNTNIQPKEKSVGWFYTASVVSIETIFDDEN